MKEVRECPICDWKHETERPQVPAGALASVFGPGVMSAVAMQQHAWDIERALDAHFRTHSTVDWVKATVALRARVAELEAANTGLATEAQRLKAGLRFYARGLHFSPGDAICWDDVSGEPPNFLCDEYGTTIEDGTIAKDVLLGRDAAWSGEDWPPEELPEEIGLPPNKPASREDGNG